MKNKSLTILTTILLSVGAVSAQVAQGGAYRLEQSVLAAGGGTTTSDAGGGGTYSLLSTIGEPIAGVTSTNASYSVRGGFLTPDNLAPTAAPASVSGRVLTDNGRGLRNARVVLTNADGARHTVMTSSFGYFQIDAVAAGQIYVLTVESKQFVFAPQIISVTEDISELTIVAAGRNSP